MIPTETGGGARCRRRAYILRRQSKAYADPSLSFWMLGLPTCLLDVAARADKNLVANARARQSVESLPGDRARVDRR